MCLNRKPLQRLVVFIPCLVNLLQTSVRLDVVWDRYIEGSLKSSTREKRGSGSQFIVKSTTVTPTPKNWQRFLRVDENKTVVQLSYRLRIGLTNQTIYCTKSTDVVATSDSEKGAGIVPCYHEKADTQLRHSTDPSRSS